MSALDVAGWVCCVAPLAICAAYLAGAVVVVWYLDADADE